MTPNARHTARLVMRVCYTVTGFFVALLTAAVAHDGLTEHGFILPSQRHLFGAAAFFWAVAVVLEGLTGPPAKKRPKLPWGKQT